MHITDCSREEKRSTYSLEPISITSLGDNYHMTNWNRNRKKRFDIRLGRILRKFEYQEDKIFVPRLFTLYCKLLCDLFSQKKSFLTKLSKTISPFILNTWKYSTDEEILHVLSQFSWTLKFIVLRSNCMEIVLVYRQRTIKLYLKLFENEKTVIILFQYSVLYL